MRLGVKLDLGSEQREVYRRLYGQRLLPVKAGPASDGSAAAGRHPRSCGALILTPTARWAGPTC
jgi:hypothetical protein